MKHYIKVMSASALLFVAPLVATAFENTGVQDIAAKVTVAKPVDVKPETRADVASTDKVAGSSLNGSSGTILGVPGLGTVGVIPNLDFGMEFLYGNESKLSEEPLPEPDDSSLQIRGTIKHRF